MSRTKRLKNPSRLPGTYENRVFVGGSYRPDIRSVLDDLEEAIRAEGFVPVLADRYEMTPYQIHDLTLYLLHSCRYAVFEASELSGALMELERTRDYATRTLVLWWASEVSSEWETSRMLQSFRIQKQPYYQVRSYVRRPQSAMLEVQRWLRTWRKHGAKLDG